MTKPAEQIIIQGDDTLFEGQQLLSAFILNTTVDLTGWTARFILQKSIQTFSDITSKRLQPHFSKLETRKFALGPCDGKLELYDSSGNKRTQFTDLPYRVIDKVDFDYWSEFLAPDIDIELHYIINYEYASNKPKINGVELIGDKSTEELHIDVSTKTFVHEQGIASNVWTITHNLNRYPSVTIVDSANTVITCDIDYISLNVCTATMNTAITGKAFLV